MVKELVGSSDREHFGVVCMDTKNQPTHISIVSVGTLNASMVHPREVFKIAIISNSASIIAFHNHPSGNTNPSGTDLELTERLAEAGRIIGIELIDHIIVSDAGYLSMREKRMI
jgi:DNA repair protein RadC